MNFIISIVIGIGLFSFLFLKYSPVFGKKPSKDKIDKFTNSLNFRQGKFVNQIATSRNINVKAFFTMLKDFIKGNPHGRPNHPIPIEPLQLSNVESNEESITWFGHSSVLLEIEGKRILLDPMFANNPSPIPFFGSKRYSDVLPSKIEDLPSIDAVILSHDHYDHLDYDSIIKLKDKVSQFYVPLGVGSHLASWGIREEKIKEHDWWDESAFEGLRLVCAPSRHFSGRSSLDGNTTLWCSWIIAGRKSKIYFSGDGGYGPHFKEIGEKYGPFDLTLMECGQYDGRWAAIHMIPEQTVEGHLDVQGKLMIPIHWAAFSLALHDWTDPIERVIKAGKERKIHIATPKIGEKVIIGAADYPNSIWWR